MFVLTRATYIYVAVEREVSTSVGPTQSAIDRSLLIKYERLERFTFKIRSFDATTMCAF